MSNLKDNLKIIDILKNFAKEHPEMRFQQILWAIGIIGKSYNDSDKLEIEDRFYENSDITLKQIQRTLDNYENERLENLHKHSIHNAYELSVDINCQCFHCGEEFTFSEIKEWTDNKTTAICPKCGIDAIISKKLWANEKEIKKLHDKYFGNK